MDSRETGEEIRASRKRFILDFGQRRGDLQRFIFFVYGYFYLDGRVKIYKYLY